MTRKHAFTLIELLVVIAIIAILAAILFPVFARARAKAREISCLSNVKQIVMGMNMYSQDYDEAYPRWRWDLSYSGGSLPAGGGKNDSTSLWFNAIYPYVKSSKLFQCPDANYTYTVRQDNAWGWFTNVATTGMNPALLDQVVSYGGNEPLLYDYYKLSAIKRPAETLIVADCVTGLTGSDYWDWYDPNNLSNPNNLFRLRRVAYANGNNESWFWTDPAIRGPFNARWEESARHNNGNNIGYSDGHAKWLPASRTTLYLFGIKN